MAGLVRPAVLARARLNHVAPEFVAFDPANKTSNVTLSVNNTDLANNYGTGAWGTGLGIRALSSGKRYFEIVRSLKTGASSGCVGAGIGTDLPMTYPGGDGNSWAHLSDGYNAHSGYSRYGVAWDALGDVLMIAFDIDAGKLWFGANGTWMASSDPGAGSSPAFSGIPSGAYKIIGGAKFNYGAHGIRASQSPAYTVPSGFSYWPAGS